MSGKIYKILQGSFRADDGSAKGPGDEIAVGDDQVDRFPGQLEYLRDVPPPAPAPEASSSAGPAPAPAADGEHF